MITCFACTLSPFFSATVKAPFSPVTPVTSAPKRMLTFCSAIWAVQVSSTFSRLPCSKSKSLRSASRSGVAITSLRRW